MPVPALRFRTSTSRCPARLHDESGTRSWRDIVREGSGRLNGKKAVITGGDSGIGRAVAIAYAREGADVLISYLDEHDDARETERLVTATGGTASQPPVPITSLPAPPYIRSWLLPRRKSRPPHRAWCRGRGRPAGSPRRTFGRRRGRPSTCRARDRSHGSCRSRSRRDGDSSATPEKVVPEIAIDPVVSLASVRGVVSFPGGDTVVPGGAEEKVGAGGAIAYAALRCWGLRWGTLPGRRWPPR